MKILVLLMAAIFLAGCSSSATDRVKATVVTDCTGKYLRIAGKDYHVCNEEILKNHGNGSVVTASFEKTEHCPQFENKIVCMMYHENEGMIRINSLQ